MPKDSNGGGSVSLTSKIGRRRFVELTGIGIAGGLAGCAGGQDDTDGGTTNDGSGTQNTDSGEGNNASGQAQSGGQLRVRSPRTLNTISPIHTQSKYTNFIACRMLYSQLSSLDYDNERQNDLARNWEVQDDELTQWVVEIRDDATFNHNDEPVRASDVVATYQTIIDGDFPGKGSLGGVASAEEIDETTVSFQLESGNADFPVFSSRSWSSIVPEAVLQNDLDKLHTESFGSGPFVLESYPSESELVLKRNPNYYETDDDGNALPYVDTLTLKTVADHSTAITQIQNGETDIDRRTDISQLNRVKGIQNVEPSISSGGTFIMFVMDNAVEPWNDNRVRKAMKLAIDREQFLQNSIHGAGRIANDSVLAPLYRYHKELPQRTQDIERAKELLAEAGYPDGFHLTKDFDITLYTPGAPEHQLNSAILFKEQFKQIGVEMELQQLSYDQYVSEVWGQAPTYCGSYGTYFNENSLLAQLLHSDGGWWGENHWENEEKDRAIEKAAKTTDPEKRAELYGRVQELTHEEGPYVIPYFVDTIGAHGTWVEGWQRHSLQGHSAYERAWVTSEQ